MNLQDDKSDWTLLRVAPGFEALFDALERADRKGYLPGAIKEHFDSWPGYTCAPDSHYSNVPLVPKAELDRLQARVAELEVDAERLRIRGETYERAYGIAYRATYQSHNGHWDSTMRGGLGCRECISAREARENCEAVLREGLQALVDRAAIDTARKAKP